MNVMNLGIILRNDHGETFPVAINPQTLKAIQMLLLQIPNKAKSGIVDPSGRPLETQGSVPIIPRLVKFDWEEAYKPMDKDEELKLMKTLQERYEVVEAGAKAALEGDDPDDKVTPFTPQKDKDGKGAFTDPENPYNLTLDASGTANVDMPDGDKGTPEEPTTMEEDVKPDGEESPPEQAEPELAPKPSEPSEPSNPAQPSKPLTPERKDETVKPDALSLDGGNDL